MEYPRRKHPRLNSYDYSLPGCYYVTIHMLPGEQCLSIIKRSHMCCEPTVILTDTGKIAEQQMLALKQRYDYLEIDKYVIMPTHIHAMIRLTDNKSAQYQRPGLMDMICAYKSLTTRELNQKYQSPGRKWFQVSFYEHIIRSEQGYRECWNYIDENPARWLSD